VYNPSPAIPNPQPGFSYAPAGQPGGGPGYNYHQPPAGGMPTYQQPIYPNMSEQQHSFIPHPNIIP
jgi:hypothetical protein